MAMEGKTSACAHLSPMGNLAAACCDTWSNESVQNIKLLGGMAPTCYMEQLAYDCRLMNTARSHGKESARQLQRWLVESDVATDPQAFIISPESAVELAQAIVASDSHYHAGVAVARKAVDLLRSAHANGKLRIAPNESSGSTPCRRRWTNCRKANRNSSPSNWRWPTARASCRRNTVWRSSERSPAAVWPINVPFTEIGLIIKLVAQTRGSH